MAMREFDNRSLENWQLLGAGGFGFVYRADHKDLGKVAIKIAKDGDQSALCREAKYMDAADQQYVPMVYGMYEGRPPNLLPKVKRQGIVMELMDGGSLETLLQTLSKPPPWPLAFRLVHQVALAMDFLHSKAKLVHMDLKPDNVLLDANLNAKIADFGLSTVSNSILDTTSKIAKGGTLAFTAPEAFEDDYHRSRAYDIYSYAILLWTIMTGEKPYAGALIDLTYLKGRIQMGDRPPLDKIDVHQAAGLEDLVELMKRCWDEEPKKRPRFKECIKVTSRLFSRHEEGIDAAVSEVQKELKGSSSSSSSSSSMPRHEEGIGAAVSEIQANLQELKPLAEKHAVSGPDGKIESVSNLQPQASLNSLQSSSPGPKSSGNSLKKFLSFFSSSAKKIPKKTVPPVHVSHPPVPPVHVSRPPVPPVHVSRPPVPPVHVSRPPVPPVHVSRPPVPPVHVSRPPVPPVHVSRPPVPPVHVSRPPVPPVHVSRPPVPPVHVSRPPVPPGSSMRREDLLPLPPGSSMRREDLLPHVCELTLDPLTASIKLSLSENNMKAEWRGRWGQLEHHDHPDRFKSWFQVMSTESLTGRCYREIEWKGWVGIAVTYRGISREGDDSLFGYNDMSWSLECDGVDHHRYTVRHNKKRTVLPVSLSSGSGRVAVYVDHPAGSVSFYTMTSDTLRHLHTFHCRFTEPLYAGFNCGRGSSVSL